MGSVPVIEQKRMLVGPILTIRNPKKMAKTITKFILAFAGEDFNMIEIRFFRADDAVISKEVESN